ASSFNARRAECEEAVKRLKIELPELVWLASWPTEWLPRLKRALKDPPRARAPRDWGNGAHPLRRAAVAAGQAAPVWKTAVRIARIVSAPVRMQRARARY